MRKSVIAFLTMLTLALGIAPAFALAAEPGGGLSAQSDVSVTVTYYLEGTSAVGTPSAGGTISSADDATLTTADLNAAENDIVFAADDPAKDYKSSYTFAGWYKGSTKDDVKSENKVSNDGYSVTGSSDSLIAYYTTQSFTVKFYGQNNQTVLDSVRVQTGGTVASNDAAAAIAKQVGYAFDSTAGWKSGSASGSSFTIGTTPVYTETNLYGAWDARIYQIAYAEGTAGDTSNKGTASGTPTTKAYLKYGEGVVNAKGEPVDADGKTSSEVIGTFTQATSIAVADGTGMTATGGTYSDFVFDGFLTGVEAKGSFAGGEPLTAEDVAKYEADMQEHTVSGDDKWTDELTLTAQWKPVWNVTYSTARGTAPAADQVDAAWEQTGDPAANDYASPVGVAIKAPATTPVSDDGYVFDKWTLDGEEFAFGTSKITKTSTLVAAWKTTEYTVTFSVDGETFTTQTVATDGTATKPEIAAEDLKEGYTDIDWFSDSGCENAYVWSSKIRGDTTIYGKWKPQTYKVKYNKGRSADTTTMGDSTFSYDVEGTLTANAYAAPAGTEFVGWAKTEQDANNGNWVYADRAKVTNLEGWDGTDHEVTLYAVFKQVYDLTYAANVNNEANAGFKQADGTFSTNDVVTKIEANTATALKTIEELSLERPHYKFDGWKNVDDGSTYTNGQENVIKTGNTTLTAQWKGEKYSLSYDANGGEAAGTAKLPDTAYMRYDFGVVNADDQPIAADGTVIEPAADGTYTGVQNSIAVTTVEPARTGYEFDGWSTTKDDADTKVTAVSFSTKDLTADTVLYALWKPATYQVKYASKAAGETDIEGATVPENSPAYEYGVETNPAIVIAAVPYAKVGYTADGWKGDDDKPYAEGKEIGSTDLDTVVTLSPNWVANTYPVEFYDEDGETLIAKLSEAAYDKPLTWSGTTPAKAKDAKHEYEFAGWATTAGTEYSAKGAYIALGTEAANGDVVRATTQNLADLNLLILTGENQVTTAKLYAVYKPTGRTFEVKYDDSGVKATNMPDTQTGIAYEGTATQPIAVPVANGYTFAGWYTDKTFATEADFSAKVTEDTTFYAKWTPSDETKAAAAETAAAASDLLGDLVAGDDDNNVAAGQQFVDQETYDELKAAVEAYEEAVKNDALTGAEIAAVEAAKAAAEANKQTGKNEGMATASEAAQSTALKAAKAALEDENLPADAKTALEAAVKTAEDAGAGAMTNAEVQALKDATTVATQAAAEAGQAAAKTAQDAADKAADAAKTAAAKAASTKKAADYEAAQAAYEAAAKAAEAAQKAAQSAAVSAAAAGDLGSAEKLNQQAAAAGVAAQSASNAATSAKSSAAAAKKAAAKKATNPMKVKQAKKTIKAKATKKTTVKGVLKVTGAKGKVTVKTNNKKVKVTKAGKVTVKKGLKKTTTVKITITAAGDNSYNKATKTLKLKVKVSKK